MDKEKVTHPMHLSPRCGAYARRTGNYCKSPAMTNGRCRMHGGKTPIKNGFRSKAFMEKKKLISELIKSLISS